MTSCKGWNPTKQDTPSRTTSLRGRLYSGSRGCGFFFPGDSTWLSSGYCYDARVDTAIHWPHCIINQDVVTLMCTDRKGWVVGLKLMQQNVFLVSVSRGFLISYFSPSYHGTLFFYFPSFFHRLKLYHRVRPPFVQTWGCTIEWFILHKQRWPYNKPCCDTLPHWSSGLNLAAAELRKNVN